MSMLDPLALVKVDTFPFTRYGAIGQSAAGVGKFFRDAVDERYAPELTDAANNARPQGAVLISQPKAQVLAFPATITLARLSLEMI